MLTVLLATRNRARILREVLEAFCCLEPPSSGWKLVVVDNGSTDDTSKVIASFAGRLPLQAAYEPTPGKNAALNTGLAFVAGDLTVLTDDDVFPHTDWLLELRKATDDHPEYSMLGGVVVPRWEVPPPPWIEWLELGPIFTITPKWLEDGPIPQHLISLVQGPNMAVRTRIFETGTRFETSIGPSGTSYPMGSETELILRLGRQGHRAWHVRSAVIEHFVRKEQLDQDWILQRAIRYGRGHHRLGIGLAPGHDAKMWGALPRHLFRDMPKEALRIAVAWLIRRQDSLLRSRWRFNYLLGKGIEARNMAREQRQKGVPGTVGGQP